MNKKIPDTELLYTDSSPVDKLTTSEALKVMLSDHENGLFSVRKALKEIEKAVKLIYSHIKNNHKSKIIYCGAGTSGRIGVQDGVELNPTFGWPTERLDFILAGGVEALTKSIENSEDDIENAKLLAKKHKLTNSDVVIGLAASGNTRFTEEILKIASKKDSLTIAISNNPMGSILGKAKINIVLDTKQEVIAGSTRLKAATAQKVCLNLISTMLMIKLGNVKDGQMINLIPNNKKLIKRKLRIEKYFGNK
jgi:N-acetylmuramic acid 6-phosphate etherase